MTDQQHLQIVDQIESINGQDFAAWQKQTRLIEQLVATFFPNNVDNDFGFVSISFYRKTFTLTMSFPTIRNLVRFSTKNSAKWKNNNDKGEGEKGRRLEIWPKSLMEMWSVIYIYGKMRAFFTKVMLFRWFVVAVYLALESHTWNECDDRNKRSNDDGDGGARRQNVMNTLIRRGRADTVPYNIFQLINFHFPIKSVVSFWSGQRGKGAKGQRGARCGQFTLS